jgi:hypothetical protein
MPLSQYFQRLSGWEAAAGRAVSTADLGWFAKRFADLADPEVIARAWH